MLIRGMFDWSRWGLKHLGIVNWGLWEGGVHDWEVQGLASTHKRR